MKVFVGGSARQEIPEKYIKISKEMIEYLAKNNFEVIGCADERGIVGSLYQIMKNTKRLILTLPKVYKKYAENIEDIAILTDTINERTDESIKQSDFILFFPGGIGTIYEIFSCIETKRAGEHNKPILILNYENWFTPIVKTLEKLEQEKFISEKDKETYFIANSTKEAIMYIEQEIL